MLEGASHHWRPRTRMRRSGRSSRTLVLAAKRKGRGDRLVCCKGACPHRQFRGSHNPIDTPGRQSVSRPEKTLSLRTPREFQPFLRAIVVWKSYAHRIQQASGRLRWRKLGAATVEPARGLSEKQRQISESRVHHGCGFRSASAATTMPSSRLASICPAALELLSTLPSYGPP